MSDIYIRQRDNLLYEQLVYTGNFFQPISFDMVSYNADTVVRHESGSLDDMLHAISDRHVDWLAISGLSDLPSLEPVLQYLDINRLWMQDILNTRHIAKIDVDRDSILVVMDYFFYTDSDPRLQKEHLAIVFKPNLVVTFQESDTFRFRSIWNAIDNPQVKLRRKDADYLFNMLISNIVNNYLMELDRQRMMLMDIEEAMLENRLDEESARRMQLLRRNFLLLRKNILPMRGELSHLDDSDLINDANRLYFVDTHDHIEQVFQLIDSEQAIITSLTDYYNTANDQRLNHIVGRLTILSAIFIPLTFMAGIWGMNFKYMPELDCHYGYFIAIASMVAVAVGVVIYFKVKKWL